MELKNGISARIAEYFPIYPLKINEEVKKTDELFFQLPVTRLFKTQKTLKGYVRGKKDFSFMNHVFIDENFNIKTTFTDLLKERLTELNKDIQTVNVLDYGAIPDGKTDSTLAFQKAILRGNRKVIIPAGEYVVRGLTVPSHTELIGAGSDVVKLTMHPNEPKRKQLLRNRHLFLGDRAIIIQGMTLDWNIERFGRDERSATGGIASSGITLAHVAFALVRDMKIIDPGLHGVDVTSAYYSYGGDGTRSRFSSRFIWIDQVEASGFGDDGITTHHSDSILISNCYLHHPSGRAHQTGFSNSNGIEVDDGTEHCVLMNNLTEGCFGGVEIKAHEKSSAASDTQIVGHLSHFDNRSFNFRHIGHHQGKDCDTRSALGIRATFLVAISPTKTPLYLKSEPRALVVSAYNKVVIHHLFSDIGKIAIQYRARSVRLVDVKTTGKIKISKNTVNVGIL
ncbi:glycosyl hydrolase family 28-related protein [Listeria sp. PSOL-1]|uniref:glycosyl hydrolase family 28-related protein n=1 Tax=Listeria sp. PSOL-1 TaxID=1844999 RepID=UPI0018D9E675|nr:glycosyl hydrolase family 28-related protein [Listeria sp. PSOL-1]